MNEFIDFTDCKRLSGKAYNGANGKKIAIEYNGDEYMLKFPPSGEGKKTELSYTNGCVSEHIASSIFNIIGINAQQTLLGTFSVGDKKKIVCACRDFTSGGKRLFDFCSIKNTIIDSETNGTGTELDDVIETIEKQRFVEPLVLKEHFWEMFIVDAILGNFDRHNGNWGFLYDPQTDTSEMAPIYDCGSCLLPQADEKTMIKILNDKDELNKRIYMFPTSALKIDDIKINYYDFISSAENEDCNAALLRIYDRIDLDQINGFIDNVPYISDLQKRFYKTYISARVDIIIRPVYDIITSEEQNQTNLII